MEYVRVADTSDLVLGQMKRIRIEGRDILLANIDSTFYALADACPHRGGSLCGGSLTGSVVQCPRHGARFDVRTGKALAGPKMLFFRKAATDVAAFPVLVDGNSVFVGLPDRAASI